MKLAIAGAGAMGGRFGYMLSKAGIGVTLIDQWEPHIATILDQGLQVNNDGVIETVQLPIYRPEELDPDENDFDLIILFPKSLQLDGMLQAIKPLLTENTNVLCLLNGLGHETIVEKYVAKDNIYLGCTMWTAGLEGPGKIKLLGSGNINFQNLGEKSADTGEEIAQILSKAGLGASYCDNVMYEVYKKACANGATNALCTLLEVNLTTFGNTRCAEDIVRAVVSEYSAVAAVEGVKLDVDEITGFIVNVAFNPEKIGRHFPSMYQDLVLTNRRTEVDCINGIIGEKGTAYGISTPYCEFITQLTHCKEDVLGAECV